MSLVAQLAANLLAGQVTAVPARVCPGWNITYCLRLANTSDTGLTQVVIQDALPEYTCCPVPGEGDGVTGVVDTSRNSVIWNVDELVHGEVIYVTLQLHLLSGAPDGIVIDNAFTASAAQLMGPLRLVSSVVVDRDVCSLPGTATPTASRVPTPTVTRPPLPSGPFLPLLYQDRPGGPVRSAGGRAQAPTRDAGLGPTQAGTPMPSASTAATFTTTPLPSPVPARRPQQR